MRARSVVLSASDNMSLWAAIREAAVVGDEAKLDQLVLQGVSLDMLDEKNGHAVLHDMAYIGSTRGIELLIQRGANINVPQGESGLTPLHIAASCGHADLVQRLIELGANLHAKDSDRPYGSASMPLHIVALRGNGSHESLAILRLLLNNGGASDLLIGDADGDTPLHCAALNSNPGIMRGLFSISSISSVVNLPNHKGQTPLHLAVGGESSGNIETARLLLSVGAIVDARDAEGATPFHFAVGKCNLQAISLLLNAGAKRFIRDRYGATPFHYAARSGNVYVLDILNKENIVDDRATENHLTPLHYAAWNKRNEAVEWLLERTYSVDVMDALKGDTPLHLAARRGDADVIQTLIRQGGADTQLTNKKGQLALGLADDRGHHDAAKAFVKAIREQNRQDRLKDSLWTKHSSNGATLLHYFAAYGAEEDMEWILKVIKHKTTSFDYKLSTDVRLYGGAVNIPDRSNRTAVHWAAMRGNTHALKSLAHNNANLNADVNVHEYHLCQTPLYFALIGQKESFAHELMKLKSENPNLHAQDWIRDISRWMEEYYNQDANREKLATLKEGFKKHKYPPNISDESLFHEFPPIYLALHAERDDIATFIQKYRKGEDDAVNERGQCSGRTALHWATLLRQRKIVAQLCRKLFKDDLAANVEDNCRKTALQYAKEMDTENKIYKDIEKELMQRRDVSAHIDGLYKDRQVYVDAANAILVGAALIAGVTFAGWLQPPLGYVNYYNLPKLSAPPTIDDAFQSYVAIQQHGGVRWFWVFNCLSFSFAIATVLAGLVAVVPIPGIYIATSVAHLRKCLLIAAALLGSSIVFVLVAFAAAGFTVLPPLFKYQASMLGTTIVGAVPCVLLLTWFCRRLALLCPEWLLTMNAKSMWKLKCSSAKNICRFCLRSKSKAEDAGFCKLESAPAQIVVDSSTHFRASTMREERTKFQASPWEEITTQKQSFEFNTGVNSSMPEDNEDYRIGEDYDESPWNDGLNVTANIIPSFSLS